MSQKSITLSGSFGLDVMLPTVAENFEREILSSKRSQNNTGSYAKLTEATSDLIASGLNASHSSLNSSSVRALFERRLPDLQQCKC